MKIEFTETPNPNVRHISLLNVQEIFYTLGEEGWDLSGEMCYGFYFVDCSHSALVRLANELAPLGYEGRSIRFLAKESIYQLQLETVASHTPESIHELMKEFSRLAYERRLVAFDGWDVAPVDW